MNNSLIGDLNSLQFKNLSKFDEINHFVTTRKYADDHNLKSDDLIVHLSQNLENIGVTTNMLFQMHGNKIKIVSGTEENKTKENGDAMITQVPNQCLLIKTADCIPILLYDSKNKVVASVHAGWRGSLKEVAIQTVLTMVEKFNSDPLNIFVGIGPGIGPEVYEVGKSVFISFTSENKAYKECFVKQSAEKYLLNLWEINKLQLLNAGIPEENIELSEICNYSDTERFFSARKEGMRTGRILSGIYLK